MVSLQLPLEVIERVIGHSGDHPRTLHNFSLTCHDLRPRALCLLVADVRFKCRGDIFKFCDFIRAKPHLKPLVRSVAVNPDHFVPFPLLGILPNLYALEFTQGGFAGDSHFPVAILNWSISTRWGYLATRHVQALHLSFLSFSTYSEFFRVLLAFPNLTELVCSGLKIEAEGNQAHVDVLKQRLSNRLRLRTVHIEDYAHPHMHRRYSNKLKPSELLLNFGLVQSSTVETLAVQLHGPDQLWRTLDWPRLQSLVLKLRLGFKFDPENINTAIVLLKDFSPSMLKDVVVELHSNIVDSEIHKTLVGGTASSSEQLIWEELEQTLLRFPQPRIVWLPNRLHKNSISKLTQEFRKHLPVLSQRGAFTVTPRSVILGASHDNEVREIATSPDSKWVATSAHDSTIILWDTTEGAIVQRWIPHTPPSFPSLAFSPDSRFLVTAGRHDSNVKIWDLAEGVREVAALEGHTSGVNRCAWSPHGDIIASGSEDSTVRLWDARAFHALYKLKHSNSNSVYVVAFSPDGRWIVSGDSTFGYWIWNVASGTLHKSFQLRHGSVLSTAVFDPRSTRLLMAHADGVVKLVDIQSGEEQVVFRGVDNFDTSLAFSPDGTLVLASTREEGMLKLWDAYTGNELFWLEERAVSVYSRKEDVSVYYACFSPCGKYVTSALSIGVIRLWRTRDGSCVKTLSEHKGPEKTAHGYDLGPQIYCVAFSPDGETLWSGDSDGAVIMRRMREVIPTYGLEP